MIDRKHAVYTQVNNVVGTLNLLYAIAEIDPSIHLVKLGTMGEYGTPNIDIEEGFIEITTRAVRTYFPTRSSPVSFYHLSKVHDSHNIHFACRIWGLRSTDLNQGSCTARKLPRRCCTVTFGPALTTTGVRNGAEPLRSSGGGRLPTHRLRQGRPDARHAGHPRHARLCRVGLCQSARTGEYRVFNQFTESFSVIDLAEWTAKIAGGDVTIDNVPDPRSRRKSTTTTRWQHNCRHSGSSPTSSKTPLSRC